MNPKMFVGSSSEALALAEAVQSSVRHVADVTLWNQGVFRLNETALDSLLAQIRLYDYAVFILAADDRLLLRGDPYNVTRDNVIFELGLFISALGPKGCFFLTPQHGEDFHVPGDLAGITSVSYDLNSHDGNIVAAIGAACTNIVKTIRARHALSGEWLLFIDGSNHDEPNGRMHITCTGDRATARLAYSCDQNGNAVDRSFHYEGRYIAGQFVLNFEQRGAEEQIVGCMTMIASPDRGRITGVTTFWHHARAEMVTENFKLRRPTNQH